MEINKSVKIAENEISSDYARCVICLLKSTEKARCAVSEVELSSQKFSVTVQNSFPEILVKDMCCSVSYKKSGSEFSVELKRFSSQSYTTRHKKKKFSGADFCSELKKRLILKDSAVLIKPNPNSFFESKYFVKENNLPQFLNHAGTAASEFENSDVSVKIRKAEKGFVVSLKNVFSFESRPVSTRRDSVFLLKTLAHYCDIFQFREEENA